MQEERGRRGRRGHRVLDKSEVAHGSLEVLGVSGCREMLWQCVEQNRINLFITFVRSKDGLQLLRVQRGQGLVVGIERAGRRNLELLHEVVSVLPRLEHDRTLRVVDRGLQKSVEAAQKQGQSHRGVLHPHPGQCLDQSRVRDPMLWRGQEQHDCLHHK